MLKLKAMMPTQNIYNTLANQIDRMNADDSFENYEIRLTKDTSIILDGLSEQDGIIYIKGLCYATFCDDGSVIREKLEVSERELDKYTNGITTSIFN